MNSFHRHEVKGSNLHHWERVADKPKEPLGSTHQEEMRREYYLNQDGLPIQGDASNRLVDQKNPVRSHLSQRLAIGMRYESSKKHTNDCTERQRTSADTQKPARKQHKIDKEYRSEHTNNCLDACIRSHNDLRHPHSMRTNHGRTSMTRNRVTYERYGCEIQTNLNQSHPQP